MKIEGLIFAFVAVFLGAVGAVYLVWSGDPMGGVPIVFGAGLGAIIGWYFLFTSRRMEPRPEDRPDADIEEGAGEIGFFSPHSWWPLFLAISASTLVAGAVFGLWLVLIGGILTLLAVSGFVLEYYVKGEA